MLLVCFFGLSEHLTSVVLAWNHFVLLMLVELRCCMPLADGLVSLSCLRVE